MLLVCLLWSMGVSITAFVAMHDRLVMSAACMPCTHRHANVAMQLNYEVGLVCETRTGVDSPGQERQLSCYEEMPRCLGMGLHSKGRREDGGVLWVALVYSMRNWHGTADISVHACMCKHNMHVLSVDRAALCKLPACSACTCRMVTRHAGDVGGCCLPAGHARMAIPKP